jgi:D-tyrosyl-tRNA(Tyr) deacylase
MRAVVQRVLSASVSVEGELISSIGPGLLVLAAVGKGDTEADVSLIANKLCELRIFEDPEGKMNLNVSQIGGAILLVSQFTLFGDVRKGNRPSFDGAELPVEAQRLFEELVSKVSQRGLSVSKGKFRAHMKLSLINDGPVTILLDSRKLF